MPDTEYELSKGVSGLVVHPLFPNLSPLSWVKLKLAEQRGRQSHHLSQKPIFLGVRWAVSPPISHLPQALCKQRDCPASQPHTSHDRDLTTSPWPVPFLDSSGSSGVRLFENFYYMCSIYLFISSTHYSCFHSPLSMPPCSHKQGIFLLVHFSDAPQCENKQKPLLIQSQALC